MLKYYTAHVAPWPNQPKKKHSKTFENASELVYKFICKLQHTKNEKRHTIYTQRVHESDTTMASKKKH
jgi:hypothetical protein